MVNMLTVRTDLRCDQERAEKGDRQPHRHPERDAHVKEDPHHQKDEDQTLDPVGDQHA